MNHQILSQHHQLFYLYTEPKNGRFAVMRQDVNGDHETGKPYALGTFRYRESAESAVHHYNANGRFLNFGG